VKVIIQALTKDLEREIRRLSELTNRSIGEIVEQRAGHVARDLAYTSQPWGLDVATKKKIEGAVKSDIRKVYLTERGAFKQLQAINKPMAKAFSKFIKQGKFIEAEQLLSRSGTAIRNAPVDPFDFGRSHRASQDRRTGRVRRHRPAMVLTDDKDFTAYLKRRVANAGLTKAGWIRAAMNANLPVPKSSGLRVGAWVTRHTTKAKGSGRNNTFNTNRPSVTLTNGTDWASSKQGDAAVAKALMDVKLRLRQEIKNIIAANAKKLNA